TILYENNGKNDFMQTGEMIQVGLAWRIIDAPTPGDVINPGESTASVDPAVQPLLDQLKELDAGAPKGQDVPGPSVQVVRYNMQRADTLQKIIAKVKPEEKEQWVRQVVDCLSAAAQAS